MPTEPNKQPTPVNPSIQSKVVAVTAPTSAAPLELLRKYSSPKPVRRGPDAPPQENK
jgi:hypothetical protein